MKILFYMALIALMFFSNTSYTTLQAAAKIPVSTEGVAPAKPSVQSLRAVKKLYKKETKGMNRATKKAFYEEKIAQTNAKLTRVPLFFTSLALVLIGCLIVFIAWSTIGYLGSIIAIIGILLFAVWLIFRESEAAK